MQKTAIVYAAPPTVLETDIVYPLRPYIRDISNEDATQAINSLHTSSLLRDDADGKLAPQNQRGYGGKSAKSNADGGVGVVFAKYTDNAAHRSTPDTLEGAFVPDLVFPLPSSTFMTLSPSEEHDAGINAGNVDNLEALKAQYLFLHIYFIPR